VHANPWFAENVRVAAASSPASSTTTLPVSRVAAPLSFLAVAAPAAIAQSMSEAAAG
jgi:hypothetical protein